MSLNAYEKAFIKEILSDFFLVIICFGRRKYKIYIAIAPTKVIKGSIQKISSNVKIFNRSEAIAGIIAAATLATSSEKELPLLEILQDQNKPKSIH